jgi:hypothetical protein
MYYRGPIEMGGIIHAFCGGIYGVLAFHFSRWLRSRFPRPAPGPEPSKPTHQRTAGSGCGTKSGTTDPAPLS